MWSFPEGSELEGGQTPVSIITFIMAILLYPIIQSRRPSFPPLTPPVLFVQVTQLHFRDVQKNGLRIRFASHFVLRATRREPAELRGLVHEALRLGGVDVQVGTAAELPARSTSARHVTTVEQR